MLGRNFFAQTFGSATRGRLQVPGLDQHSENRSYGEGHRVLPRRGHRTEPGDRRGDRPAY